MIVRLSVVLRRIVVGSGDWRFDNLSGSHHQTHWLWCFRELIVVSQVPLSLQQFYLTKENLKMCYNLEGVQWRPWRLDPILNSLAESNHKLRHTFSKYQFAIILEMEEALKTTFRASSHQSSGLSIAAVYTGLCSIIIRYLRSSALGLFMQSWFIETLVVSCTANGTSVVLGEIFCFFKLKSLLELIIN